MQYWHFGLSFTMHMVLKVLRTSDGWVSILSSGTSRKGTKNVKARRQRGLWSAIFRAQHSHCIHDTAHTISEQFQLPSQDLQKTRTVKKQSLTGEGFMGPYFSLLNNGYNGFWGKVTVIVQVPIDSTKPMVSQTVSDKISGSQDNKRIESEKKDL